MKGKEVEGLAKIHLLIKKHKDILNKVQKIAKQKTSRKNKRNFQWKGRIPYWLVEWQANRHRSK